MQLLYKKLKKPIKQPKVESLHKIKLNQTKIIITKTIHLVKKKNNIITKLREWTELTIKNIKNLIEVNQVKKLNINKLWENNLTNFGRIIHLNNTTKIIKKELLKNKDYKNINIFEEQYKTN